MKIKEIVYLRVQIFIGNKTALHTIDPDILNRKYYKNIGKDYVGILKRLIKEE